MSDQLISAGYGGSRADWSLDLPSWHCHGSATEAFDELQARLNEFGLIDTHGQASQVLSWMLEQPPENQPAPVEWTVVALARP